MIGLNAGYQALFERRPDLALYVIEEPELVRANPSMLSADWVREVREGAYQQADGAAEVARAWHAEVGFDVVLPGMEYAVRTAFTLAEEWGLGGPGSEAARVCTDKYALRVLAARAGLPQPRFAHVSTADEVHEFFNGRPIVLKPANRRASVGVVRVDRRSDIDAAWRETTETHEGARTVDRDLVWRFQTEEYLDGTELSVETIVANGNVVFDNVTAKETVGGRHFTEIAHLVPAPLDDSQRHELLSAVRCLLRAMGAVDGVFHSEWRLCAEGPRLIECAARPPGDLIPTLIHRASGVDLYEAFITVLSRRPLTLAPTARAVTTVRFFRPPQGEFVCVEGQEHLSDASDVFDYEINLRPGQRVPTFANSWQRAGYYALEGADHATLTRRIAEIDDSLTFVVH
jgi:biotin carboxylase